MVKWSLWIHIMSTILIADLKFMIRTALPKYPTKIDEVTSAGEKGDPHWISWYSSTLIHGIYAILAIFNYDKRFAAKSSNTACSETFYYGPKRMFPFVISHVRAASTAAILATSEGTSKQRTPLYFSVSLLDIYKIFKV